MVSLRQPFKIFPWKRQFQRPAEIAIRVVVQGSVDLHFRLFAWKAPAEITEPTATRMILEADAVKGFQLRARKLGRSREAAFLISIVPDEEHFITGVERVDLELVV